MEWPKSVQNDCVVGIGGKFEPVLAPGKSGTELLIIELEAMATLGKEMAITLSAFGMCGKGFGSTRFGWPGELSPTPAC